MMKQRDLDGDVIDDVVEKRDRTIPRTYSIDDPIANILDQVRLIYKVPKSQYVDTILSISTDILTRMSSDDMEEFMAAVVLRDKDTIVDMMKRLL